MVAAVCLLVFCYSAGVAFVGAMVWAVVLSCLGLVLAGCIVFCMIVLDVCVELLVGWSD